VRAFLSAFFLSLCTLRKATILYDLGKRNWPLERILRNRYDYEPYVSDDEGRK